MTIDFLDLQQARLYHTIDVLSLAEDADSINGLDFYSAEAKLCKIEFFEDDWTLSHLRNISPNNHILDTDVVKYTIRFNRNGVTKIYYIEKSKIKYNKKTRKFTLVCIDLLGLFFKVSESTIDFSGFPSGSPAYYISAVIELTLGRISNLPYNVMNSGNYLGLSLENFKIPTEHSAYREYLADDPYWFGNVYEAQGLWKYIGVNNGELMLYLYYEYEDIVDIELGTTQTDKIYYKYKIDNKLIANNQESYAYFNLLGATPVELPDEIDGLNPETSQLTYTDDDGNIYSISGANLYFTGTFYLDNIRILPDNDGKSEYKAIDIIKAMALVNNLYIYSIGNDIYIGNKSNFQGEPINIADNYVLEFTETYTLFSGIDLSEELKYIDGGESLAYAINEYYNELREDYSKLAEIKILNVINLNLLDIINVFGENYVIFYIDLDVDGFSYSIKAWRIDQ